MHIQLYFDDFLNLTQIFRGKNASAERKPHLADGRQLIHHSLAFLPIKDHDRLAGIKSVRLACERDNLDSIQEPI